MNELDATHIEQFNNALKLKDEGKRDEAIIILKTIAKEYPLFAPTYGVMGGLFRSLGKFNEAIECFKKVVELKPLSELGSLGLFHSLWDAGKMSKALDELKRFQSVAHSNDYDEIINELKEKGIIDNKGKYVASKI